MQRKASRRAVLFLEPLILGAFRLCNRIRKDSVLVAGQLTTVICVGDVVERTVYVRFGILLCPSGHFQIAAWRVPPAARPPASTTLLRYLVQRHGAVPQCPDQVGYLAGHRWSSSLPPDSTSNGRRPSTELSQCSQASKCGLISSNVLRLQLPQSGSAWAAITSAGTNLPPWPCPAQKLSLPSRCRASDRRMPTSTGLSTKIPSTWEKPNSRGLPIRSYGDSQEDIVISQITFLPSRIARRASRLAMCEDSSWTRSEASIGLRP